MELIDNLVMPQSAHHMVLLKFLLVLTYLLFLPYISVLLGSAIYSVLLKKKATADNGYLNLSKQMIDLVTGNKYFVVIFGIVPLISLIFNYSQLLDKSGFSITGYLFTSLFFLIIAAVFIYQFKNSAHMRDLIGFVDEEKVKENNAIKEEVESIKQNSAATFESAGTWGIFFLLISIYFFTGAVTHAPDASVWSDFDVISLLLSLKTFINFISFIVLSLAAASGMALYVYFKPNLEKTVSESTLEGLKQFILKSGLISLILVTIMYSLNVLTLPMVSLSFGVFSLTLLIVIVSLWLASSYYFMSKEDHTKSSLSVIFLFLILFSAIIVRTELSFSTGTHNQYNKLAAEYTVYQANLMDKFGIGEVVAVSGEDIYNSKCIACHQFEQRLVGPAYKDVLPKYEGKRDELVGFILNPVKVNPEYTAMPNQGLKPSEAEAIADYIISVYQQNQ